MAAKASNNGVHTMQFTIEGVDSLIMHNGAQLKDPLSKVSKALKEVSSRKNKTDEDYEEMARIEWFASLYTDEKKQIVMPGFVLKSMLVNAAKKSKQGPSAKAALTVFGMYPVDYDGPRDIDQLYKEGEHTSRVAVKVLQASVMRTRPEFKRWSITFNVSYMSDIVNDADVVKFVETAGREVGLCEWRPEHGRFVVKSKKLLPENNN